MIEDNFIGQEFVTPKGGILKVIGKSEKSLYKLNCSICSEDKELFSDPVFYSSKGNLKAGSVPCGCAFNPKWNEHQNLIRAKRLSKETIIVGSYSEDYKGISTKIKCTCTVCGHNWSMSVDNLIREKGCPSCKKSKLKASLRTVDYEKKIQDKCTQESYQFIKFKDDYKNPTSKLTYICKEHGEITQAFDKFISNGCPKCSVVGSHIKRRNKNPEETIQNRCNELGYNFLGFKSNYTDAKSRFNYECPKHGVRESSYDNFINAGCACQLCSKEISNCYGYFKDRLLDLDNLYIIILDETFIKVGRSFIVDSRIKDIKSESGIKEIEMYKIISNTHEHIYKLEQHIHRELKSLKLHYPTKWSTECFNLKALEHINSIIEKFNNSREG